MTTELGTLLNRLAGQPKPVCAELTPFVVTGYEPDSGIVRFEFAEQPLFRNHFGNVQGGFAVAMMDVVNSLAAFAKTGAWLPTVEIKTSFVEPLPIGIVTGEGKVLKSGRSVVFVDGRLFAAGKLCIMSTATLLAQSGK